VKVLLQIVTDWRDPVSWAIRFSTRSWASHAEFVLRNGTTFGARCSGVRLRAYEPRPYSHVEWFSAPEIEYAYEWARTQAGKKYDFSAIAGIATNRNWRDQSRWFCSELIAASFEQVGAPLLNPETKVWRITPRDLLLSTQIWPAHF